MEQDIMISVEHLTKEYRSAAVVEDVSFEIRKKGIYGLVGPNGAGKTTIMKMLGGLVIPTSGEIHMYGQERGTEDEGIDRWCSDNVTGVRCEEELNAARRHMSFMIESPYLRPDYNVIWNLEKQRLMKGISDKSRIEEVLDRVGLADVDRRKHVRKYSMGMRQRLGIAVALLSHPDVMVLDEPINGLDPEGIIEIRELLLELNRTQDVTILISSHILTELSHLCTDYLFIHHGKIVKSITGEQIRKECETGQYRDLEEYYLSVIKAHRGLGSF